MQDGTAQFVIKSIKSHKVIDYDRFIEYTPPQQSETSVRITAPADGYLIWVAEGNWIYRMGFLSVTSPNGIHHAHLSQYTTSGQDPLNACSVFLPVSKSTCLNAYMVFDQQGRFGFNQLRFFYLKDSEG